MEVERIEKEDFLYRRVAANQLNPDGTVSSAAFKLHGKADPSLSPASPPPGSPWTVPGTRPPVLDN